MNEKMSLRDTILPKSDQLNYDDLVAGPITTKVVTLQSGSEEQPVIVVIEGHRPFRPCKSMRRVLIAAWGDKGRNWIGKRLTLYGDPKVKYGGVEVGGIRISHMSGIDKPLKLLLTTTRSKRGEYTVQPLKDKDEDGGKKRKEEPETNAPADDGGVEC